MRRGGSAFQPSMVMMGMRMLRLPNIEKREPHRVRLPEAALTLQPNATIAALSMKSPKTGVIPGFGPN